MMRGQAPFMLFFHGTPGSYHSLALTKAYEDSGFGVIIPSRPGYMRTPAASGDTPEDTADLFAALLDTLEVDHVVAHSISGGGVFAV